jgi:SlyX protein
MARSAERAVTNDNEAPQLRAQLVELQTQLAFQEDALQTLDTVVARQQQQIDELERQLRRWQQQVSDLRSELESGRSEAPPPHY